MGTFVICSRQRHASDKKNTDSLKPSRLRKKARIAVTTHKRIIRGGAVMPFHALFCAPHADRQPTFLKSHFGVSICARDANVVTYAKGHVCSKITPHALQTTILHGCLQETYSSLTGSVRSGFPCECVSSQFLWVTRASCVHRMVVGIKCVDWCLLSGIFVVDHLGASTV